MKEKLFIGEATVATVAGLILGPHCLDWFDPVTWGNTDYITLEISRIVLCIQIVAVAVELPRKYMKKHWLSVAILLLPVMTAGWLVVGLFIWCLIPHFDFPSALLVSACVTATDPVLAAAVVGKGKFAERVPGHLRNLLSAESGCNDGMAFPFIYLSLNLILHHGNAGEIVKDWICLTLLWECLFGCLLGAFLGFILRKAVAFAEAKGLIDRESFLAIFVFLAFNSAGIGSMLGVDDLLVSFAAGTAFGWNGDFAKKTEESHVSTVIDLLLNLAYFVYFGAIIPWPLFNDAHLGLNAWRLVVLAIVIIFLRRLPAVLAFKHFTPDIKSWREALFCGHFGPIGVGAIFAVILARKDLEGHYSHEETPLAALPDESFPHYQLLAAMWPIVCFIILTSIIVHGSSVAVLTLGKRLNRMAITMSFTTTNTRDQGPTWMSRLQKLEKANTGFSLHRIDSDTEQTSNETKVEVDNVAIANTNANGDVLPHSNTIETSGVKFRPAGGAKRKKHKKKKRPTPGERLKKSLSRQDEHIEGGEGRKPRPQTEFLQLGRNNNANKIHEEDEGDDTIDNTTNGNKESSGGDSELSSGSIEESKRQVDENVKLEVQVPVDGLTQDVEKLAHAAYQEGDQIVIEDKDGEVLETLSLKSRRDSLPENNLVDNQLQHVYSGSIHSEASLRRAMTNFSNYSEDSKQDSNLSPTATAPLTKITTPLKIKEKKKAFYRKSDPKHRKVYAHQIDDMIVIENEDGEIIRRYKVNRHASQSAPSGGRARSGSIVGKALSYVGIKGKGASAGEGVGSGSPSINAIVSGSSQGSGQAGEPVLVKEHDSKGPNNPLRDSKLENSLELKITNILKGTDKTSDVRRRPTVPEIIEGSEEEEDSEASEDSEVDDSDDDSDEILHESEVEKRRRLAALGLGKARGQRDEDDEED